MQRCFLGFHFLHGSRQSLFRERVDRRGEEAPEFLDAQVKIVALLAHGAPLGLLAGARNALCHRLPFNRLSDEC
jgi:hypothetical protein